MPSNDLTVRFGGNPGATEVIPTGVASGATIGSILSQIIVNPIGVSAPARVGFVTPIVPAPTGLYPNQDPTYETPFIDRPFTLLNESPWTTDYVVSIRNASTYTPVNATPPRNPPVSPQSIGEVLYQGSDLFPSSPFSLSGIEAGGSSLGISTRSWSRLYMAAFVQLSSNFISHPSGVNKKLIANIHGSPCFVVSATSASFWEFRLQALWSNTINGGGAVNINNNFAAPVTKGLWQRVEVEAIANTPGVTNGIVRLWLSNYNANGVLVSGPTKLIEALGIGWSNVGQATTWTSCSWSPIYGGTATGTLATTIYEWMDHIHVAGHV